MEKQDYSRLADFLYELGTMRKLMRMHCQVLLTDDMSDNIASHSYRVVMIGWIIAEAEEADVPRVLQMCLVHDIGEIRTSDHNWLHKRYVHVDEEKVQEEQLGTLPFSKLKKIAEEYEERKTKESFIAKDADLLDQILLLREYACGGNKEAQVWLDGKREKKKGNKQFNLLQTETAKKIGKEVMDQNPTEWWKNLWTHKNSS